MGYESRWDETCLQLKNVNFFLLELQNVSLFLREVFARQKNGSESILMKYRRDEIKN